MKHLLLALVHVGAEPTAGGPRFTFSLFISFTRGVCKEHGLSASHTGLFGS